MNVNVLVPILDEVGGGLASACVYVCVFKFIHFLHEQRDEETAPQQGPDSGSTPATASPGSWTLTTISREVLGPKQGTFLHSSASQASHFTAGSIWPPSICVYIQVCHILAVWFRASHFTAHSLGFLTCTMESLRLPLVLSRSQGQRNEASHIAPAKAPVHADTPIPQTFLHGTQKAKDRSSL